MTVSALKDLVERTAAAWGLAFVGLLLADGFDLTSVSALKAAGLAAVPAGLQVVYSALAAFVGDPKTAGLTDTRDRF
jgi:hypothetical protein